MSREQTKQYQAQRLIRGPRKDMVTEPGGTVELTEEEAAPLLRSGALTDPDAAPEPDPEVETEVVEEEANETDLPVFDPAEFEGEMVVLKPFDYDRQSWQKGETVTIRGDKRRVELYNDGYIAPPEPSAAEPEPAE